MVAKNKNRKWLHTIFSFQGGLAAQKKKIQIRFPNQSIPISDKTDFVCLQEHPNPMPTISKTDAKLKQQIRHQFKSQLQLTWDNSTKKYKYMPIYSRSICGILRTLLDAASFDSSLTAVYSNEQVATPQQKCSLCNVLFDVSFLLGLLRYTHLETL